MLTRLRLAASVALFATLTVSVLYAQNPTAPQTKGAPGGGGGPGGGGPGGPGGGGPGGFGGFGRGGNGPANDSVERLIQIEAVQEVLKIDDKTKAKIKVLGEDATKERNKRRDIVTKQAAAAAAEMQAREQAMIAEQLAEAGIVVDPKILNANSGGGRGNRGGGPGGFGGNQIERTMMNMAMASLASKVDATMLKLLDTKQKSRLKQIMLQQEGTRAFTDPNPDVVEKLGMTEEQLASVNNVNNELRNTQRQAMPEFFNSFAAANGIDLTNNNNGGGGGGRGGRGGFPNLGNMDPAVQAKFQAAMADFQTKNSTDSMAAIGTLLTKQQKTKYNNMVGETFDVAKLRQAPGGPGGPGAPGAPAAAATTATKTATPPADSAPTKPARKSLRDSRSGD